MDEPARVRVTKLRRAAGRYAATRIDRTRQKNGDLNTPVLHGRFEQYFVAGLRKAGEPEE
jgi:hypothetical protein